MNGRGTYTRIILYGKEIGTHILRTRLYACYANSTVASSKPTHREMFSKFLKIK